MQKTKTILAITALALIAVAVASIALAAAQPLSVNVAAVQNRVSCNGTYSQNCTQYMQGQSYGYCQGATQNGQFHMGMGFGGCHR